MSEFSQDAASGLCIPEAAQMHQVIQMSNDRTGICEPDSLDEELDGLREQALLLKEAGDIAGAVAEGVRGRIAQIYRRSGLTDQDRANIAGVAGLLNPVGDVNAH